MKRKIWPSTGYQEEGGLLNFFCVYNQCVSGPDGRPWRGEIMHDGKEGSQVSLELLHFSVAFVSL